jgi:ABC-2 type transport system ATP-binding protein
VSKRFQLREGQTLKEFLPHFLPKRRVDSSFYALKNVSFSVGRGESVGIIGPNGSGKSTALKIIAGVMRPSEGRVFTAGRVAPLIELGTGFHPDLTGRENVFLNGCILGMTNREIRGVLEAVIAFAELEQFIDLPIKRYSSGMYLRLAFAVAVHCKPDILLIDEALAVGDLAFRDRCFERLQEFRTAGVTILLVSHSLDMVTGFCDRALLLMSGSKVVEGLPQDVVDTYREMVEEHSKHGEAEPSTVIPSPADVAN